MHKSEAIDRRAEDGGEVSVIGFVGRVRRLAELMAGKGMNQARLPAGAAEGVLDGAMISAGLFDGDENVAKLMLLHRLSDARDAGLKIGLNVGHDRGRDEDVAKEIAEDVLRAQLGAVDADDAEVLGSDGLDALMNLAMRLVHEELGRGLARATGRSSHGNLRREDAPKAM